MPAMVSLMIAIARKFGACKAPCLCSPMDDTP